MKVIEVEDKSDKCCKKNWCWHQDCCSCCNRVPCCNRKPPAAKKRHTSTRSVAFPRSDSSEGEGSTEGSRSEGSMIWGRVSVPASGIGPSFPSPWAASGTRNQPSMKPNAPVMPLTPQFKHSGKPAIPASSPAVPVPAMPASPFVPAMPVSSPQILAMATSTPVARQRSSPPAWPVSRSSSQPQTPRATPRAQTPQTPRGIQPTPRAHSVEPDILCRSNSRANGNITPRQISAPVTVLRGVVPKTHERITAGRPIARHDDFFINPKNGKKMNEDLNGKKTNDPAAQDLEKLGEALTVVSGIQKKATQLKTNEDLKNMRLMLAGASDVRSESKAALLASFDRHFNALSPTLPPRNISPRNL